MKFINVNDLVCEWSTHTSRSQQAQYCYSIECVEHSYKFVYKQNKQYTFFAYNIFQFQQLETQRRKKNDQQNEIFNISSDLLYIILTLFAVFRTFLVSVSSHISELILCRHTHSNFHTFRETKTAHYINKRPTNGSIRMERNGATAAATANRNMVHICCQSLNHT